MADFESIKKIETSGKKQVTDYESKKAQQEDSDMRGIMQKSINNPGLMSARDIMQMQRSFGNRAVCQMMDAYKSVQRLPEEEEEEPVQGKFETVQKIDEENEEEEPVQGKFETVQMSKNNNTGMPDEVKNKMERAFQTDFSDVKVHTNSEKASDIGALAYTQGSDVHFASGQYNPGEQVGQRILGHELAHVVQQREGRVQPTTQAMGMPVNDDSGLESEADNLGARAAMSNE